MIGGNKIKKKVRSKIKIEYQYKYYRDNKEKMDAYSREYNRTYMRKRRAEERRIYLLMLRNPERDIKEDFNEGDLEYITKINDKRRI